MKKIMELLKERKCDQSWIWGAASEAVVINRHSTGIVGIVGIVQA